jgi:hypothetical protein
MDNNKRTKLKVGDIISFELNTGKYKFNKKYGFARVLANNKLGDVIEVYDYFSDNINDYINAIISKPLFEQPIILDGYSIFWKKTDGKWYLLGNDKKYEFKNSSNIKYKFGPKGLYKLIDLNGKKYEDMSQEEIEKYPDYSPYNNSAVLRKINYLLEKRNNEI